jgi:septum formation protein
MRIYLASASPRRTELLAQIALPHEVLAVNVPEELAAGESAEHYSLRVACAKASAGLAILPASNDALVIGADTEVVLDGEIFGKPRDALDAATMLRRLSAQSHTVLSSVAIAHASACHGITQRSLVRFRALSEADIERYIASGEAFGKAGAYAIQGRAAEFIADLQGSYSGVMGLPLFETCELLKQFLDVT